ncbi:heat shock factor protein [Nephila pilipes]|uniref:Heat shock factor protein n=1 Tax=Nephila pilipes TaxID=299642 RepID=A0A8X6PE53_NEPPI|nr:heat shock factor protein [Nephila pilipes]
MASFVRQLNMYGFRKLSCVDQGGMHCYKNEIEFYHQYFLKGQESLLELIKRKIPNSKSDEPRVKQEYLDELISSIRTLKGKQDTAEHDMKRLRDENEVLWTHLGRLSDKYAEQETVIKQLLPFFMNMVRSSREITLKRKASLMIDDGESHNKIARLSPQYFVQTDDQDSNQDMPMSPGNVSNRGPVIHDVTEMENSKMYPAAILCASNSTTTKECEVIVDSPLSSSLESTEQTIDSPFTEPGSMEKFNILNQNYERRSRSNSFSPQMEMKHSPISVSSSSLGLNSPATVSSYSSTSSCISPAVVIDENTSDVPLPDNMMRSSFIPKIEDSCSDSSLYTMNSLINNKVAPVINEETISILTESTSPLMNGSASTSSGSQYTSNNYMQNVKNVPQMNWMMNQAAYAAAEPNFDNWLGQLIKSDNITPGSSMPHTQGPVGVNFVQ